MDDQEATEPSPETAPERSVESPLPRLSVLHLMMWITFSAIYLALYRAIFALQESSGMQDDAMQHATGLFHSILTGAELTAATVLLVTRVRTGPRLCRQPGHIVALTSALMALITMPVFLAITLANNALDSAWMFQSWFFVIYALVSLVPTIIYGVAGVKTRRKPWRIAFFILCAAFASQVMYYIAFMLPRVMFARLSMLWTVQVAGTLIASVVMLVASIVDRKYGIHRDWIHWVGVITFVAQSVAGLAMMLMNMLAN